MKTATGSIPLLEKRVRLSSTSVAEFSTKVRSANEAVLNPQSKTTFREFIQKIMDVAKK